MVLANISNSSTELGGKGGNRAFESTTQKMAMCGPAGALYEMCPFYLRALPDSEKLVLGNGTGPAQRKILPGAAACGAARPSLEPVATEVRAGLSSPNQCGD